MPTGLGVDVHPRYQAGATFPGVEYAWIKMTDGGRKYTKTAGGVVYTADEHARRLRAAGIPFGGYDYAQPGDGAAAARGLLAECRRLGGLGVTPATDIEDDPNIHTWSTREAIDHGRAFCAEMRKNGIRPAVYMNASKMAACRPDEWPEDPVIWVARYGAKPEAGGTYRGHYDVHQYTSSGSLPGSAGAVDWNQAYTNAHLINAPQEDDMPSVEDLIHSKVIPNKVYGDAPDSLGSLVAWTNAEAHWANAKLDALNATVGQLVKAVANVGDLDEAALARELAPLAEATINATLERILADKDTVDEKAVAQAVFDEFRALLGRDQ